MSALPSSADRPSAPAPAFDSRSPALPIAIGMSSCLLGETVGRFEPNGVSGFRERH